MSVEANEVSDSSTARRTGTVLAVCYSKKLINKVGKEVHSSGEITRWGIPGDKHYGEKRYSPRRHIYLPNNRPITVVGREAAQAVCATLEIPEVPVGGLGENVLLEGLGDLSDLVPGEQLHFIAPSGETTVILEVRKQNEPCAHLLVYHRLMPREMFGRRGVICSVLQEGAINNGDRVEVHRAAATA